RAEKRAGKVEVKDNGVLVSFAHVKPDTRVSVKTEQGEFDFTFADIPYGTIVDRLNGAVEIERTGTAQALTTRTTDDDYPSATVPRDGPVSAPYETSPPGRSRDDYNRRESNSKSRDFISGRSWGSAPDDYSFLAKPAGGDQVWLRAQRDGKWSEPLA